MPPINVRTANGHEIELLAECEQILSHVHKYGQLVPGRGR